MLRAKGAAPESLLFDLVIGTFCIGEHGHFLLHQDRDFRRHGRASRPQGAVAALSPTSAFGLAAQAHDLANRAVLDHPAATPLPPALDRTRHLDAMRQTDLMATSATFSRAKSWPAAVCPRRLKPPSPSSMSRPRGPCLATAPHRHGRHGSGPVPVRNVCGRKDREAELQTDQMERVVHGEA